MLDKLAFKTRGEWIERAAEEMRRREFDKKHPQPPEPQSPLSIPDELPKRKFEPPKPTCECGNTANCKLCKHREVQRQSRYFKAQRENQIEVGIDAPLFLPEEDAVLRRIYGKIKYENNAFKSAEKALPNRTPSQIFRRTVELGLIRRRQRFRWTEEELQVVEAYSHCAPETIQKKLVGVTPPGMKRTRAAIAGQIHVNRFRSNLEGLNLTNLSEAIGLAHDTLKRYVDQGLIKSKKLPSLDMHKAATGKSLVWFFPTYEVYMFVIRYPGMVDLRRVNQEWFMDLVGWGSRYDADGRIRTRKKT